MVALALSLRSCLSSLCLRAPRRAPRRIRVKPRASRATESAPATNMSTGEAEIVMLKAVKGVAVEEAVDAIAVKTVVPPAMRISAKPSAITR